MSIKNIKEQVEQEADKYPGVQVTIHYCEDSIPRGMNMQNVGNQESNPLDAAYAIMFGGCMMLEKMGISHKDRQEVLERFNDFLQNHGHITSSVDSSGDGITH